MGEVPLLTGLGPTMVACWWQEWQLLKTVIVVCWLLIVDGYRIFPLSHHVTQLLILQYYRSSYAVRNSSTNQVFSQLDPSFWLATVVPTSVLFISSASSSVFVLLREKMSQLQQSHLPLWKFFVNLCLTVTVVWNTSVSCTKVCTIM